MHVPFTCTAPVHLASDSKLRDCEYITVHSYYVLNVDQAFCESLYLLNNSICPRKKNEMAAFYWVVTKINKRRRAKKMSWITVTHELYISWWLIGQIVPFACHRIP